MIQLRTIQRIQFHALILVKALGQTWSPQSLAMDHPFCSSLQLEWARAVETTRPRRGWSTPLTSPTSTALAASATGPSRSPDHPPSSSTSPSSTSLTRPTWWSCWTVTPTRWWRASTGAAHHGRWWTSRATLSYSTSTRTAPTRPRALPCFTKVSLAFPLLGWNFSKGFSLQKPLQIPRLCAPPLYPGSGAHLPCWWWSLFSFYLLVNGSQPCVIRHI